MVRGIWIHEDRQRDGERALRWITARCNHANLYWGTKDVIKQVDAICARCGRRVRFNPNRTSGNRGKIRQALWISRPKDSRRELESRVHHLNKTEFDEHEGFVTALELMKNKSPSIMGGELD